MDFDKVPNMKELENWQKEETEILPLFEVVARMEKERGHKDRFPTGIKVFDDVMWGGVTGGDLVVISGRSGEGKTTLAQTYSYQFAELGLPQLWFSYEMDLMEIANKFKAMGIKDDFLGYVPLKLTSGKVDWIERRVKEAVLKFKTKVIFIDHLGFLAPRATGENAERNLSIYLGQIARQLKTVAIENDVIVFLLAHTRKTKDELELDDIAYSGGIGQESDFVFMVERERLKSHSKKTLMAEPVADKFTPYNKILLAKNRRTGHIKVIKTELRAGRLQPIKLSTAEEPPSVDDILLG